MKLSELKTIVVAVIVRTDTEEIKDMHITSYEDWDATEKQELLNRNAEEKGERVVFLKLGQH